MIRQGNGSRTRGNTWHGVSSEKDEAALEWAKLATLRRSAVQIHFTGRQRHSKVLLGDCSGGRPELVCGCERGGYVFALKVPFRFPRAVVMLLSRACVPTA